MSSTVKWLNSSIWIIDVTLSGITAMGQSGTGIQGYSHSAKAPGMEPHHQMGKGVLLPLQRCSQCILLFVLSSADSCSNIHIYAGYILTQWITDAGRLL